jgi:hypothetical protein
VRRGAKTADICNNGCCEKILEKDGFGENSFGPGCGFKNTKKTSQKAAAEKAACQRRPAGRGADRGPYRPFRPDFRGVYSFPRFG